MSDYSLPVITKALLVFNILIHVTIFLTSTDMGILAISGQAVWVKGEYYRIITSAFTHAGILHIAMNMSSLVQLGSSLERQFGSLPFLFLTIWSLFLVGGLYVTIACTLTYITANNSYIMTPSVGYSGILFLYAILEAYHTRVETSSFFGVCNVPARMYPFILLFAIQFLLPGTNA
jgi:membrane associated rhomboid family serine protease